MNKQIIVKTVEDSVKENIARAGDPKGYIERQLSDVAFRIEVAETDGPWVHGSLHPRRTRSRDAEIKRVLEGELAQRFPGGERR